ncbi:ABC transporter substrate-binding protein [Petrotoga sp. 9PWA.NaAc.5.4]|uniref:ABC transporter substrate-binding protein n=1 Tax=Petrotoga sp. 9PWA.NaAc.5.4 TaxID=1434328 RepID=UPI000CCAB562|nr:extracellular solute-binding protein [Petrotoga sp. 9PWA.NaAc.5.4]PNR96730.1 sugar ABC transporter substrate-binding protein [Petrotoga sp. 9PWA.NaAc.5.4]
MKKVFSFIILTVFIVSISLAVDLTMYVGDATMGRNMSKVVEIYEKENPGINIDVVVLPYYGGFMQKVALSIMSGEVPDLIQVTTAYIPQVAPYLINLSPYIKEKYGLDPQEYKDSIYDVTNVYLGSGDVVHAVPLEFTIHGLWVNKEMFKKAGISYPPSEEREEPWTWDEFKSILDNLKKTNKIPYALSYDYSADRFFSYLSLWNIKVLDENLNFVLDTYEDSEKAIDEFLNLFRENYIPKAEWLSGQAADQDFYSGRTAAYWSGSWQASNAIDISKTTGKEYDVAFFPKIRDWFGIPGGSFLGAFQTGKSEKENAAIDFIMWMADKEEGYLSLMKTGYYLTAYEDHYIDYENEQMNEWAQTFAKLGERAPVWTATSRANEVWSRLTEPIRKQLSLGIAGNVTAKEIITNIKIEYERIMEDLGL